MGITAQPANATWLKIDNSHNCVLLSLHFQPFKSHTQGVTSSRYGHTDVDLSRKQAKNKHPCIVTHKWFHLVCCWSKYGPLVMQWQCLQSHVFILPQEWQKVAEATQ